MRPQQFYFFIYVKRICKFSGKNMTIFTIHELVPHVEKNSWFFANESDHTDSNRCVLNHPGSRTETLDFIEPSNLLVIA